MKTITQKQIDHVADTAQIIASNLILDDFSTYQFQFTRLLPDLEQEFAMDLYKQIVDDQGSYDHIYAACEQNLRCGLLPKGWALK